MFRGQKLRFNERFQATSIFHYGRLPLLTIEAYKNRVFLHKRPLSALHPKLMSRSDVYRYFENQFRFKSRHFLWQHNSYFKQCARGFGEPAFHAAWQQVFEDFKPKECLEIGVYRGQTISLWSLLSKKLGFECSVYGITPLTAMGDSVSQYLEIDFAADIQLNFDKFKLGSANILNRSSTSKEASEFISSGNWNLVYIDGSHDYQDVLSDYRNSISGLAPNGIVVLDDSSLFLDQIKDYKAFQGHPGPSNICMKYALNELEHFLSVGHLNFFRRN